MTSKKYFLQWDAFAEPSGFIPADDTIIMDKRREHKKSVREITYAWKRTIREREREREKEGLELNELYKTLEKRMTIKNSKIYYCIL